MPAVQQQVQHILDELIDSGSEIGLQVAVHHQGDLVVDAVAGIADRRTGRRVIADVPFFSFSAGKVMTALIAHLIVGTGAIDYDTPVADVWPEFAARGKATVTLRHVSPTRPGCRRCLGRSGPPTCTTGTVSAPHWPPQRRGGHPVP